MKARGNKIFGSVMLMLVTVIGAITFNGCSNDTTISMGELDYLNMIKLDSTKFEFKKSDLRDYLLAVVYSPGCEHCQAEAKEFYKNRDKLQNVTMIMIGSEPLKMLRDFSEMYGLNQLENVKFVYASPVNTFNLMRVVDLPHMRLYDRNFKPLREFIGTTPMDKIYPHIK